MKKSEKQVRRTQSLKIPRSVISLVEDHSDTTVQAARELGISVKCNQGVPLLVVALCLLCSGHAYPARDAPKPEGRILHGSCIRIRYDEEKKSVLIRPLSDDLLGLFPALRDHEIEHILGLPSVEVLNIPDCDIHAQQLERITQRHKLRHIFLGGYIGDDICYAMSLCKSLEEIVIYDGKVSMSGIINLSRLRKLKRLEVFSTRLNDSDMSWARKRFPGIRLEVKGSYRDPG